MDTTDRSGTRHVLSELIGRLAMMQHFNPITPEEKAHNEALKLAMTHIYEVAKKL